MIPRNSSLWATLESLANSAQIVVFAGIPGAGKSLLVQQLARLSVNQGRQIQILQWDVARLAFETPSVLARYPEIDGFTDPMLRRAVGYWARSAICAWSQENQHSRQLLVVEAPLIGGRLIELADPSPNPGSDLSEPVLKAKSTRFVVPIPSLEVRHAIEQARARSIANPRHERERSDARVNVLQSVWLDVVDLARDLCWPSPHHPTYDPKLYSFVYSHLLRSRNPVMLNIDTVFQTRSSVYDIDMEIKELSATTEEIEESLRVLESIVPGEHP